MKWPWHWNKQEDELDEEIRAHLTMAIRDRIASGEDPASAERAARLEFGNVTGMREKTRDIWTSTILFDQLRQDLRYAIRGMRRSPAFTAIAIASLALGIGANTAIFSLMYTIMLRPLPVDQPQQLVEFLQKYPGEPRGNGYWSPASYEHFRARSHSFSHLIATGIERQLRLDGEPAKGMVAEYVSPNYFADFGLTRPALGRLIGGTSEDPSSAVISWQLWKTRYNLDPAVIGKRIEVGDASAIIVGVAPPEYTGLIVNFHTGIWMPLPKSGRGLALIARLRPGVTLEQARSEMAVLYQFTIDERINSSSVNKNDPQIRKLQVEVEPCSAGLSVVRDRIGRPVTVLMTVTGILLLLACSNLAGLLLARGAGRTQEMAMRLSLGASKARLVRQMLTESVLLSAAGGVAGIALGAWGLQSLLHLLDSGRLHERLNLSVPLDSSMLLFAAAAAVITGLFFGIIPALRTTSSAAAVGARTFAGRQTWLGRMLLAGQVALSLVLLTTAAIFIHQLANLKGADLGFRRDHMLLANLEPPRNNPAFRGERLVNLYTDLLGRIPREIPGVEAVSMSAPTPLHGAGASAFYKLEGIEERAEERRRISLSFVAPRYFPAMSIPLLTGREFTFEDARNPRVIIINQTVARQFFADQPQPEQAALGRSLTLFNITGRRDPETYQIIGVSGDANYLEIREKQRRAAYLPAFTGDRVIGNTLVIRTTGYVNPESIVPALRNIVSSASGGGVPIGNAVTLSDQIDSSIVRERLLASLSGFFATLGALLAGIGIFGLLAYSVRRRTTEIGIRLALGATPSSVVRLIVQEAALVVVLGLAVGVPLALWGKQLLTPVVPPESGAFDAAVPFAGAALAMLAVAVLSSYVPARRAARVDPMQSLRHE